MNTKQPDKSYYAVPGFDRDADARYKRALEFPYTGDDGINAYCDFGLSYQQMKRGNSEADNHGSLVRNPEHPIPEDLLPLIERVARRASCPVNYIQCHRKREAGIIKPHFDPRHMIVPMIAYGQTRSFRCGGHFFPRCYNMFPQRQAKLEHHKDYESIILSPGTLLMFHGSVLHSMCPAADDPDFEPGGYEYRVTLLFRYTTDAMRTYGPGDDCRKHGGDEQCARAIHDYEYGLIDYLGRPLK